MRQPKWAYRSEDEIVKYLVANNIHVDRASYIGLAFMNDVKDVNKPLPVELEFDLPSQLRRPEYRDEEVDS